MGQGGRVGAPRYYHQQGESRKLCSNELRIFHWKFSFALTQELRLRRNFVHARRRSRGPYAGTSCTLGGDPEGKSEGEEALLCIFGFTPILGIMGLRIGTRFPIICTGYRGYTVCRGYVSFLRAETWFPSPFRFLRFLRFPTFFILKTFLNLCLNA